MSDNAGKRPTIIDVAVHAGVSTGTVSAVLNKRTSVRETTRHRVLRAIEDLDYSPAPSARILGSSHRIGSVVGKTVALVVKEMDNPFFSEVVLGAYGYLEENGYTTFICTSEGDCDKENRLIDSLRERFISGAIISPLLHNEVDLSHLFTLKRTGFPFVMLEEVPGLPVVVVSIDNEEASKRAVEFLIESGHRRIAHFSGPAYSHHSRARVYGVQRAYSESPLQFNDSLIINAGARMQDGYEACINFFSSSDPETRPTAVTCFNDQVAMGVIRGLAELGLKVPGDVSVIGMDDIPSAAFLSVPLTTIAVPKREMGRRAAEILVEQIEGHNARSPETVILEADLVVRASTRTIDSLQPH